MGLFVAIEGIDGSGKSTVIEELRKILPIYATKEPSDGPIGRLIKSWALRGGTTDPYVDALLFAADRLDHYQREIAPALGEGRVVVTERYVESSIAYQGAAGVDIKFIELINARVPAPDITVLLDIEPEKAVARVSARSGYVEKYERLEFLKAVRSIYLRRAAERGYVVLNAEEPPEAIARRIAEMIRAAANPAL
ncbi:dTMP kinase [Thermoproteus uzoniensis 768-20]|uniref:Probable thymidylate kinase n=1 Tax=Thermoproteus uzoniensis (strain 768-20) TaxID=999630 RepID=F2L3U1_THEU7|nr:dTMP kinase [Thermoproteus uzoniensis]AEA12075.1 dTMP kinase [Thermoproteus uzoniensis 768-20]